MNPRPVRTALGTAVAIRRFVVALIAAGGFVSSAPAQAPENIQPGVVRSIDGRLLDQVWVQELGTWRGRNTEANGRFGFPGGKPATLLFFKGGFRPLIRATTGSEGLDGISVVLEPEPRAALNLRSCRRHVGLLPELQPARVPGLQLRRAGDVDFAGYYATYKHDGFLGELSSMTGIHVGGETPTPEWVAGLSSFTVRSLTCGGDQWFDLRGATETGLESRWIGEGGSHVEYSKVPAPVAKVLDKALDNGCCR
jgi:hypothetical protein